MSDALGKALDALEFAHGAILDAMSLEDGLDGLAGQKVLGMIRAALVANGREPLPWPAEDRHAPDVPMASASIHLESHDALVTALTGLVRRVTDEAYIEREGVTGSAYIVRFSEEGADWAGELNEAESALARLREEADEQAG